MGTVEEASIAIALDGITYEGVVRMRRPSDYNPSMAVTPGPSRPSPHLNLAVLGDTPRASVGSDGPDRLFVGGLPDYVTEEEIVDVLSSFGPLRAFDLVKDNDTGNSKGYGFCVYQDPSVMDIACASLDGFKMGSSTLKVCCKTYRGQQPNSDQAKLVVRALQQIALQQISLQELADIQAIGANAGANAATLGLQNPALEACAANEVPTKVVCLSQVLFPESLIDDIEYEDIREDVKDEFEKYGTVTNIVIPRPSLRGEEVSGIGMVFVAYDDTKGSAGAKAALHGRRFAGHTMKATYYSEEKFFFGDYGG